MRIRMFLIVAAIGGFAMVAAQGCFYYSNGPDQYGSSMDRAARCATPMAITAWSAMPITGIASASTRNMDRVRGAAGDSGFDSGASA